MPQEPNSLGGPEDMGMDSFTGDTGLTCIVPEEFGDPVSVERIPVLGDEEVSRTGIAITIAGGILKKCLGELIPHWDKALLLSFPHNPEISVTEIYVVQGQLA